MRGGGGGGGYRHEVHGGPWVGCGEGGAGGWEGGL